MKDARRILVVDDDPEIVQMLDEVAGPPRLPDGRHELGRGGAREADKAAYDAALVDLVMPGRDGADLAGELRRRIPGLPIGLLTGYAHSPLIPAAEKSGMAVFKKPVIIQELVEFLEREICP